MLNTTSWAQAPFIEFSSIAIGWATANWLLDAASLGSPGLDKLQWQKPVYPGDVLHVRLTVLEARPMNSKPHIGLVKSRWETFARRPNGDDEAVLLMEGWGMFRRRAAAS